jgi:hypothetical protein
LFEVQFIRIKSFNKIKPVSGNAYKLLFCLCQLATRTNVC